MKCFPGKSHRFDPTSGWCRNGCGDATADLLMRGEVPA